ncbi:MAG TPA: hypothetical protein VME46_00730 [Acidimicrobiales bacterium]|nr:hypothetical protein [Acidimicrobiales bacterium]
MTVPAPRPGAHQESRPRAGNWHLERRGGTVRQLHEKSAALATSVPAVAGVTTGTAKATPSASRRVIVMSPLDRALVLGSTQPDGAADHLACTAAGYDVVRRRSGGGAVLVVPGGQLWVDVWLPFGDPLWQSDVGRAAWWLGEAWARALEAVGVSGAQVWRRPMERSQWSSLACFAGRAAGEVIGADGAKIVGISQRRARHGALFQSSCLLRWDAPGLAALLGVAAGERLAAARALQRVAVGVGEERGPAVLSALIAALAALP